MVDDGLDRRCAELEERVRLLTIENDHLAERAEDTLLLGLIAERIGSTSDADDLIGMALEQVAVLKGIPYAGCYALAERTAWLVSEYTLAKLASDRNWAPELPADLVDELGSGHGPPMVDAGERFPLAQRTAPDFMPRRILLFPLRNRYGRPLFVVFGSDQPDDGADSLRYLLLRVVDMIGARIENLALLDQLTAMNESLDRKVHERTAELRSSESRLRTLFESAIDGFMVIDTDLRIRDANQRAGESLGYSQAELLGLRLTDVCVDRDAAAIGRLVDLARPDQVHSGEVHQRRKDGSTFPVEYRVSSLELDGEIVTLAQVRDVSERNQLLEQLNQAQKMEAVGRLAGGIAHDFNNILTAIMGQLDLLQMELPVDAAQREDLDLIQGSCERASGLTRQLLAFSRKQIPDMQPQDLSRRVAEASHMLLRVVDEAVDLRFDLDQSGGSIYGDQVQLEQILMNLVINARDAMPSGGEIKVSTRRIPAAAGFPEPQPTWPPGTGKYLRLSVADSGEGVPAAIRDKIFDPFFTTKKVGKGTGLGLALVYGMAQQHNALVRLHSEPGCGAEFEVIFPEIAADPVVDGRPRDAEVPRGSETILLAEDDASIRTVLSRLIRSLGYELVAAGDGEAALAAVAARGDPVDLVLTDVIMPRMGGVDLVAALTRGHGPVRVIYMSGYADDLIGPEELARPGTSFLQKPVSRERLAAELRAALDRPLTA